MEDVNADTQTPSDGRTASIEPDGAVGVRTALRSVRNRIEAARQRSGRAESVRLLPVSKTVDSGRMRSAYAAGLHEFGENRVQEAARKADELSDLSVRWSVIGHLQTNKVGEVARFADEFQALDSLRLAAHLDRALQRRGRSLDVFLQVNTSGEASKYGVAPSEAVGFAKELSAFSALNLRGLMTLAVFSNDKARVRACFRRLASLREALRQDGPATCSLQLSMGMSGDFEIAIEEGADVVRIGQAIFGARRLPDEHFWPKD